MHEYRPERMPNNIQGGNGNIQNMGNGGAQNFGNGALQNIGSGTVQNFGNGNGNIQNYGNGNGNGNVGNFGNGNLLNYGMDIMSTFNNPVRGRNYDDPLRSGSMMMGNGLDQQGLGQMRFTGGLNDGSLMSGNSLNMNAFNTTHQRRININPSQTNPQQPNIQPMPPNFHGQNLNMLGRNSNIAPRNPGFQPTSLSSRPKPAEMGYERLESLPISILGEEDDQTRTQDPPLYIVWVVRATNSDIFDKTIDLNVRKGRLRDYMVPARYQAGLAICLGAVQIQADEFRLDLKPYLYR